MMMIAPGMHDGFPFPIGNGIVWDGSDYTADQATACGPGTRYPVGMTLQQMAQLYWRAKSYKFTSGCAASNYGVTAFGTSFTDMTWPELDTPGGTDLTYYQIGQPEDTPQLFPESQPDLDVPWMLVLPVYQVFQTGAIAQLSVTPLEGLDSFTEYMFESAVAWTLRLFEFGALVAGGIYYPSLELTLIPPVGDGAPCGAVELSSYRQALP